MISELVDLIETGEMILRPCEEGDERALSPPRGAKGFYTER